MDLSGAKWRKSSWSSGDGGTCVEVAANLAGVIVVRDSKDPGGPALVAFWDFRRFAKENPDVTWMLLQHLAGLLKGERDRRARASVLTT